MRRTLVPLLATLAAFAPAAAPARAESLWCYDSVDALSDLTEPGSIHDTAVAHWVCADPLLAPRSDVQASLEWWFYDADYRISVIADCPTQVTPLGLTAGAAAAGVAIAECRLPATSPGYGQTRVVCFDIVVDGESLWGQSAFGPGHCERVDERVPWGPED